ncbi:hypothetical protein BH11BAC2_BH11BAC2_10710 [soil metagenome]
MIYNSVIISNWSKVQNMTVRRLVAETALNAECLLIFDPNEIFDHSFHLAKD